MRSLAQAVMEKADVRRGTTIPLHVLTPHEEDSQKPTKSFTQTLLKGKKTLLPDYIIK